MRPRLRLPPPLLALLLAGCAPRSGDGDADARLCAPTLSAVRYRYADADVGALRRFGQSPLGTVAFSDHTPPTNPITNGGATLGRVLFYDVRLSRNDRIACSGCHHQAFRWTRFPGTGLMSVFALRRS